MKVINTITFSWMGSILFLFWEDEIEVYSFPEVKNVVRDRATKNEWI